MKMYLYLCILFLFGFHDFWDMSIMFSIICTSSDFGILVYIFFMLNEHIFMSALISMDC
jgi:hypothetical protein